MVSNGGGTALVFYFIYGLSVLVSENIVSDSLHY